VDFIKSSKVNLTQKQKSQPETPGISAFQPETPNNCIDQKLYHQTNVAKITAKFWNSNHQTTY